MGRWGDGIYGGDTPLDYVLTVTNRFERELAYWFSPEKIINDGGWLSWVLAVIEGMLLFEGHNMGSSVINEPEAVLRWREAFLRVWDADWKVDNAHFPSNEPDYRKQHRQAIVAIFDRLESIARDWASTIGNTNERIALILLHPDYPLPYFSIERWINQNNQETVIIERFTSELLESLLKDIIYYLSPEKRGEAISFVEEVWAAADVLAFFCAAYEQTPGVNENTVRKWREATIEIEKQVDEDWGESDTLFQNVMAAFDRLQAVVNKYPPDEWWL